MIPEIRFQPVAVLVGGLLRDRREKNAGNIRRPASRLRRFHGLWAVNTSTDFPAGFRAGGTRAVLRRARQTSGLVTEGSPAEWASA